MAASSRFAKRALGHARFDPGRGPRHHLVGDAHGFAQIIVELTCILHYTQLLRDGRSTGTRRAGGVSSASRASSF